MKIGNLTNLNILYLNNNKLSIFPQIILNLYKTIGEFTIDENPLFEEIKLIGNDLNKLKKHAYERWKYEEKNKTNNIDRIIDCIKVISISHNISYLTFWNCSNKNYS